MRLSNALILAGALAAAAPLPPKTMRQRRKILPPPPALTRIADQLGSASTDNRHSVGCRART